MMNNYSTYLRKRGLLLVITGPSGAGKTKLVSLLRELDPSFVKVTTVTTREIRPNEVDGLHYHFRTNNEFERMWEAGELLERNNYQDAWYGSPRKGVEEALADGWNVALILDPNGAESIKKLIPDCVTVYIVWPDVEIGRQRLIERQEDSIEEIDNRLRTAVDSELAKIPLFEYLIVNDNLNQAVSDLKSIVAAEQCRIIA